MKSLIGRCKEKAILKELFVSPRAEFLALYGRRRVGKTYLIKQFFDKEDCNLLYLSGMKGGPMKQQLINFTRAMESVWMPGLAITKSWMEAFETLTKIIEKFSNNKKTVIFLDELPWLATPRSKCLEAIDYYWNQHWSHNPNIILVVCGSSASWIIKNIIKNKGGLYNRITRKFRLNPFTLKETQDFLVSHNIKFSERHVLEIYMATGGVPYYLTQVRKNLSAAQNIDAMAFDPQGTLYQDFDILFASLFDNANDYIQIIKTIAKYRYGVLQEALLKECGMPSGGTAIEKLKDLEEAGFLMSFRSCDSKKKGLRYRLIDEYSSFYLKWIAPLKTSLQKNNDTSWSEFRDSPSWKSWAGYNFEVICFKHLSQIKTALGISRNARAETWSCQGKNMSQGAQIDLLFDRQDDSITVCEIKYTDKPYKIDKAYFHALQTKIETFRSAIKTRKQIFLVFITSSGLKKSIYSEECVSDVLQLEDLFT